MIVAKDKVVSLIYELRLDKNDGEIVEALNADKPLTFLYGGGGLLPKFEENIDGLQVGDAFAFELKSVDAYGGINPNAIVQIPLSAFEIDGKVDKNMVKVGSNIPMQDSSGNRLNGVVKEVNHDHVMMDFNHPLAGNDLFFSGEITDIREATSEELHHGHIHGSGGCGGGGCSGCGDHGGGCDDTGSCCS